MTNLKINPIKIFKVDDVSYKIEFDFDAFIKFQALTGVSLLEKVEAKHFEDPKFLRALVWAGLLHHQDSFDGDISDDGILDDEAKKGLKATGKLLSLKHATEIINVVLEALALAKSSNLEEDSEKKEPIKKGKKQEI